jgi:hypothetical protein
VEGKGKVEDEIEVEVKDEIEVEVKDEIEVEGEQRKGAVRR